MASPFDLSARDKERMQKAIRYLRMFLMDTEQLNRLIRGRELEDEHLEFAIQMCISDWNSTTPLVGKVNVGSFPSLYLLMHGAAIQAMKMAGIYQSRNELSYSSGGSSFSRSNKTSLYQSWISNFASDFEAKKIQYKISKNVQAGYGHGFNSEYDLVGYDW